MSETHPSWLTSCHEVHGWVATPCQSRRHRPPSSEDYLIGGYRMDGCDRVKEHGMIIPGIFRGCNLNVSWQGGQVGGKK